MSHMVIYRSADGKPGFQQTDDLTSAVQFVERMRNAEGVESARIYRLEQVNFSFQPYYQVRLEDAAPPPPPRSLVEDAESAPAVAAPPPAPAPSAVSSPSVPAPPSVLGPPPGPAPTPSMPAPTPVAADTEKPGEPSGEGQPGQNGPGASTPEGDNGIRRGLFGR